LRPIKNQAHLKEKNESLILDNFIDSLVKIPIKTLPFKKNWTNYQGHLPTELIHKKGTTNSILNNKHLVFNKPEGLKNLNKITQEYIPNYYYLLFMKSKQSNYYFLERLKPLNEKIEVFINYSKIIWKEDNEDGVILKLNVLDIEKKKILNSYFIMISGMAVNAENDNGFFEGFLIDKNYNINVKSFTSIEGESDEFYKKIKLLPNGSFSIETVIGKIISDENEEIYTEKFSKKIKH